MVDVNSAYTLAGTARWKKRDDFYPMMIEQPHSHDDIVNHVEPQTPICLDECIRTAHYAGQAVELRSVVDIKLGIVVRDARGFGYALYRDCAVREESIG